ncbi:signal peptide containing protein [Theileria equi strain WA]|uniref:Signal peptide containing protein n=1 Tax=Theileria equi strain WA TaxID=1537102 RepID=L1LAZ0_THEEQ|nr:signal peptide containing protein [Theileria equi strain WA]EKX72303.1 signal peptide containing protein [Theileria equi strain WA]|eukprot:XP_004831755.1 signal peptide containing protein [Theileria equi strain WA]
MNTLILFHSFFFALLPLSKCGDDDDRINTRGAIGHQTLYRDGKVTLSEESGFTIDLDSLNGAIHKTYEYYDDGNHILLLTPQREITITKIVHANFNIWSCGEGEEFEYAKVYLKDNQPALVFIAKSKESKGTCRWYARDGDLWKCCIHSYEDKIEELKVFSEYKGDITLNLEDQTGDDKHTIFGLTLLGAYTRLYHPKPGFIITKVDYMGQNIWKREAGTEEGVVTCNLYFRRGKPSFFLIIVRDKLVKKSLYFLKRDDEVWESVTSAVFNENLSRARNVQPRDGYREKDIETRDKYESFPDKLEDKTLTTPARPWWFGCLNAVTGGLPEAAQNLLFPGSVTQTEHVNQEPPEVKTNQPTQSTPFERQETIPHVLRRRRNE